MALDRVSPSTPCAVCARTKSCSVDQQNKLLFCLVGRTSTNGFRFIREVGNFGLYSQASDAVGTFRNATTKVVKTLTKKLSYQSYISELQAFLSKLNLNKEHLSWLQNRGFDESQITAIGFKSIESFQNVHGKTIPGINPTLKKWYGGSGLIIPMFNGKEAIHGFSFKPDNTEFGKYTWTSYKTSAGTPVTDAKLLISNTRELPITLWKGDNNSKELYLCDGVLKTLIAGSKHGINIAGSQGGIFASSPLQFAQLCKKFNKFIFAADAGDFSNSHVINTINRTSDLVQSLTGTEMLIANWGQILDKQQEDVDEIDSFTLSTASLKPFKNTIHKTDYTMLHREILDVVEEVLSAKRTKIVEKIPVKKYSSLRYYTGATKDRKITQKIVYKPEDYNNMLREIYTSKYKYVIDTSPPGSGKSYLAGTIMTDEWEIKPEKVWYFTQQHRKPNTTTLELNFVEHPTKNKQMYRSPDKVTANGLPVLTRSKPYFEAVSVAGNCHLADQQLELYKVKSKDSLCKHCKLAKECAIGESPGEYGYLYQVAEMYKNTGGKIRANFKGVNFDKYVDDIDLAIVDEYSQALEFVETVDINRANFELGAFLAKDILREDSHVLAEISAILSGKLTNGKYGYSKQEFFEQFGTKNVLAYYAAAIEREEINANRSNRANKETLNLIFWGDLFKAFSGQYIDYSFNVNKDKLIIYKRNTELLDRLNKFQTILFLDATATPELLSSQLCVDISEILVISQEAKTYENVEILQCYSLGGLGVNRDDTAINKLKLARNVLKDKYQEKIGFIDYKKFSEPGDLHHFVDGRGSNAFQDKEAICVFGTANMNLGAALGIYEAMNGVTTTKYDIKFGEYYTFLRQSEIEQEIGRLRSIRRKDEMLKVYAFIDMDLSFLSDHGFQFTELNGYELDQELMSAYELVVHCANNFQPLQNPSLFTENYEGNTFSGSIRNKVFNILIEYPEALQASLRILAQTSGTDNPDYLLWSERINALVLTE